MNNEILMQNLRVIPDFPKKGILFRDVTTLFKNPDCLRIIDDELYEIYKDKGITKVVGIESRGFVMGAVLARRLNAGFVICRKPGKLPADTIKQTYRKEYGEDSIEIHSDAIEPNDVVLIHDDLLATGGTVKATIEMVERLGGVVAGCAFLIELDGLNGRKAIEGYDTKVLMNFPG